MLTVTDVSIHLYLIFLYPFILYPALPDPLPSTLVAVRVRNHMAMRHDFRSLEWDEEVPD